MRRLCVALLGLGACGGETPDAPTPPPDGPRDFSLVVQANVHGDIEPCG